MWKGRALFLGAEVGFKNIIGIDFDKNLCTVAKENITRISDKFPGVHFSVAHCDAKTFIFPQSDLVIYLYDPFENDILNIVLDNIENSYLKENRKIKIIYHNNTSF